MNQNLAEAPELPARMPPNVFGESLARWQIAGPDGQLWSYGPNKEAIPAEIAAMPNIQQAEVALINFNKQEDQRQQELTKAAEAEGEQERVAAEEAERREEEKMEAEIERRAQKRAGEIIAERGKTAEPVDQDPVVTAGDVTGASDSTTTDTPDDDSGDAPAENLTPEQELTAIFAKCKTKAELETQLTNVPWQDIKKAVVKLGKTPGKKAENVDILAEYLEIE